MKNNKWLFILIATGIVICLTLICFFYLSSSFEDILPILLTFAFIALGGLLIILAVLTGFLALIRYNIAKAEMASLKELNNTSREYKAIKIKDWDKNSLSRFIPEEQISCQIKADNYGNLVCKVQLDYEAIVPEDQFLIFFDTFRS